MNYFENIEIGISSIVLKFGQIIIVGGIVKNALRVGAIKIILLSDTSEIVPWSFGMIEIAVLRIGMNISRARVIGKNLLAIDLNQFVQMVID